MNSNTQLSDGQLTVISEAVSALVHHDSDRLGELVRDGGDIYMWTRDYGNYGKVDLVLPPGQPADWHIDAVPVTAAARPTVSVQVPMWTRQEGRSDLTLELVLELASDDRWSARIDDLHVL